MMDYKELERMISQQESREHAFSLAFPALMRKVYVWMTLALVITGMTSYFVATSPAVLSFIFSSKITFFALIFAELGLVLYLSARIHKLTLSTATLMFILYSVINGATLASIFVVYTMTSIAKVFFITAGTFGVMAAYGYFTKSDLTSWGKLLFMALIGLIIASVVNIFLGSGMLSYIISYVGVAIFVGLTAYDTQKIKYMLAQQVDMDESAQKIALLGSLTLYLDFVNLFLHLLRIFGDRE